MSTIDDQLLSMIDKQTTAISNLLKITNALNRRVIDLEAGVHQYTMGKPSTDITGDNVLPFKPTSDNN